MGEREHSPSTPPNDSNVSHLRRERSYRLEKSDYDSARFYIRSSDANGHVEWTRIRIPPDVYNQIAHVTAKESPFPYRSFSDFVRDAIIHRLHFLHEQWGDDAQAIPFYSFLDDLNFQEFLAVENHARRWVESMTQEVDSIVVDYCKRNQPRIALEKLHYWLERLPGREEAHHVYIDGYIRGKIAELRKTLGEGST